MTPDKGKRVLGRQALTCWRVTSISTESPPRTALSWKLLPAALLSLSGVPLFAMGNELLGYGLLLASVATAAFIDHRLMRHLALIAAGMTIFSLVPLNADLSTEHMALMGGALALAVLVPCWCPGSPTARTSSNFP